MHHAHAPKEPSDGLVEGNVFKNQGPNRQHCDTTTGKHYREGNNSKLMKTKVIYI